MLEFIDCKNETLLVPSQSLQHANEGASNKECLEDYLTIDLHSEDKEGDDFDCVISNGLYQELLMT